ncbi:MAG: type II toxin-antitoxin system VapC family toxin [Deltaproteobacteria bacterium]|nr:type II toxin-antitoxin system VapC family toxin [Deltaproteobacteria bacterium]
MTGLDTNILVRYLTQDHPAESKRAAVFIERHCTREDPGWINAIVLCELVWVLESAYGYAKAAIADVLEKMLTTSQLQIEDKASAWHALDSYRRSRADFADCLIGKRNRAFGCEKTATFDRACNGLDEFLLV